MPAPKIRSISEIKARLAAIDADERYHYPVATTFENAPLALIQVGLETEAQVLAWVLNEKAPKPRRGNKNAD